MIEIKKTDSIFVAGHTGMVGSSITRKLKEKGYNNLLLPSKNNLNLLDYKSIENWFKKNESRYCYPCCSQSWRYSSQL